MDEAKSKNWTGFSSYEYGQKVYTVRPWPSWGEVLSPGHEKLIDRVHLDEVIFLAPCKYPGKDEVREVRVANASGASYELPVECVFATPEAATGWALKAVREMRKDLEVLTNRYSNLANESRKIPDQDSDDHENPIHGMFDAAIRDTTGADPSRGEGEQ